MQSNNFIRETEARAQRAEESEAQKATELVETEQKLRALERQLEELRDKSGAPTPQPPKAPPSAKTESR